MTQSGQDPRQSLNGLYVRSYDAPSCAAREYE